MHRGTRFNSIRFIAFLLTLSMAILLIGAGTLLLQSLISRGFSRVEMNRLKENIHRIENAISNETKIMDSLAHGWASWDESYLYLSGNNPDFPKTNFHPTALKTQSIDILIFLNSDKQIIHRYYNEQMPQIYRNQMEQELLYSPLLLFDTSANPDGGSGVLTYGENILIITARPIRDGQETKEANGHLIIGKVFTNEDKLRISENNAIKIDIITRTQYYPIHEKTTAVTRSEGTPNFTYFIESNDLIKGYYPVPRLSGNTAFWIEILEGREFYKIGKDVLQLTFLAVGLLNFLFFIVYFLLLDRKILVRIHSLSEEVVTIGENQIIDTVTETGHDELSALGKNINNMLISLKESQEALEESEQLNRTLAFAILNSTLATALLDKNLIISQPNEAFIRFTQKQPAEVQNQVITTVFPELVERLEGIELDNHPWENDIKITLNDSGEKWVNITLSPLMNDSHEIEFFVAIIRDISRLRNKVDKAKFQAAHDYLTELPNRKSFMKELKIISTRISSSNECYALLYTDLDGFKPVNDAWGHDEGDIVLQTVAERLKKTVRDQDRIARVGGDEFCFLFKMEEGPEDALIVASRLIQTISNPVKTNQATHQLGISIGIAYYPQDSTNAKELYALADMAMYAAKSQGKNRCVVNDVNVLRKKEEN